MIHQFPCPATTSEHGNANVFALVTVVLEDTQGLSDCLSAASRVVYQGYANTRAWQLYGSPE